MSTTDFLFARPSWFEGIARLWDFGDTLTEYNRALTPEQADSLAIEQDWSRVGDDIRAAVRDFEQEAQLSS